jgi:hypothetical protein
MAEMEEIDLAMARIVAEDERFEAAEKKKSQGAQLETLYGQSRINWGDLLNSEPVEPDWLCYPFIERGASIAIVSEAKAGKSLLTLEIAANLAAGKSVLGNPAKKVRVLYVDMENGKGDIKERLHAFGLMAEDLEDLIYLSFPSLPFLNTRQGGEHLLALATFHEVELVIIDTLSRVVEGDENESSTYHSLYNYCFVQLKALNISVLRLDHTGKDLTKGARGSSAKNSDIDTSWSLKAQGDLVTMTRTHSRSNNGAELVMMQRIDEPLRHEVVSDGAERKLSELSLKLDRAGVARDAGRPKVSEALKSLGIKIGTSDKEALVRFRRNMAVPFLTLGADFTAEDILKKLGKTECVTAPDAKGNGVFDGSNND